MKKQFKVSIPKPCHEDWSGMTPKEKGRFCQSCSKTVVDFTQKSQEEIEQYLSEYFGQRVCGRLRREQLDTITLEIPTTTFHQTLSYQKLFLLALLFVMGTTLFSCQNSNGKKQKIEDVILIDSIPSISTQIDSLQTKECTTEKDSIKHHIIGKIPHTKTPHPMIVTTGITAIPKGSILPKKKESSKDSIVFLEEIGEVDVEDIELQDEEEVEELDVFIGHIIEASPKFPEAEVDSLSGLKAQEDFNRRMRLFFAEHFETPQGDLSLTGKHRMIAQFEIDTLGKVTNIRIKSSSPVLTKEFERVLKKLPVFIPAEQRGKLVNTKYTLPIRMDFDD